MGKLSRDEAAVESFAPSSLALGFSVSLSSRHPKWGKGKFSQIVGAGNKDGPVLGTQIPTADGN